MSCAGEKLGQQDQRPRELERLGQLVFGCKWPKPRLHQRYVAPRLRRAASGIAAGADGRSIRPVLKSCPLAGRARVHAMTCARRLHQKKRAPFVGALSRYGVSSPRLIAAACPASWPASGIPEENLCRYFFFFLPAFFFILVLSFGLDFLAELLFFFTGIDTSFICCCRTSVPKPRKLFWPSRRRPRLRDGL